MKLINRERKPNINEKMLRQHLAALNELKKPYFKILKN